MQNALHVENKQSRILTVKNFKMPEPSRRTIESSVKAVETLARKLKPELDVSQVYDEWRVYSCDANVAQIDTE